MRNYFYLTLLLFLILFTPGYSYAQNDSTFIYNSEGRSDPFVPLVDKNGRVMVSHGVINSIKNVILEGIVYDPQGESIVILNGIVLREKDVAGVVKVEKIKEEHVILSCDGREYTFKVKE